MKKVSMLLVVTMLFAMFPFTGTLTYADVPYSGVSIATGLTSSMGIILGPDDKLYVSEYSGNRIVKMDKDGSNLEVLTTAVIQPIGLAFDSSGNLYVTEYSSKKVSKVNPDGSTTLVKGGLGSMTGIVIDSHDKIFALDYSAGKVYKMDLDGSNFSLFTDIKEGTTNVSLSLIGMGIDTNDNLYISDRSNGKIRKVDASGTQSDFVNVTSPYWVSVGKDGYIYASSGNRTIQKNDISGNLVETYSTGSYTPWAAQVDVGGSIYFAYNGSDIIRILGSAETVDRTHIKLTLFYNMVNGAADPSAFTVSGVASNPQVTSADVNGSEINLTLDSNIETTDTNVTVGYIKTGTQNIIDQGTSQEIDNFSNLPVTNNILSVTSVQAIPTINVSNGTILSAVGLPASATINLSNSTTSSANLTWDNGTPLYDGDTAGTYTFNATLDLGAGIYNPNNVIATVDVIVAEPTILNITSVAAIDPITVSHGTTLNAIGLPSTVTFSLSNSTTSSAVVIWDNGTPIYDGDTAGTYTFNATLTLGAGISNPNNEIATVDVTVAEPATPSITSVATIAPITVSHGTMLNAVGLPPTVSFSLSNSTTSSAVVIWDNGTPLYDGNTPGTYSFDGTIASSSDFLNPSNLKANVNVVVQALVIPIPDVVITPIDQSATVEVNGVIQKVATEVRSTINGKAKVEVSINEASMKKSIEDILNQSINSPSPIKNIVTINVQDTTADSTIINLNGAIVKQLDQNDFDILINIGDKTYKIPAEEIAIDNVASNLLVSQADLENIIVNIQVEKFTTEEQIKILEKIDDNKTKIIVAPIEFKVLATATQLDGTTKTVEIEQFKQYVTRGFEIPNNINISDITTGIVFDQDNNYSQVPTRIYTENGKTFAEINSLSNSVYSVISNPVTVNSVKGSWSESIVNDMASRLIIKNPEQFMPSDEITRGEFIEYIVKALGLYKANPSITQMFSDVTTSDDQSNSIQIAVAYGITNGYSDGTFKPDAKITREEAITMLSSAVDIVGLKEAKNARLDNYTDKTLISDWAYDDVRKVVNLGIFNGKTNQILAPKTNLSFAEAAAAIKNLLVASNLINK